MGKNIVGGVILQCNGFEVIDLGVMCQVETIFAAAREPYLADLKTEYDQYRERFGAKMKTTANSGKSFSNTTMQFVKGSFHYVDSD